MLTTDKAASDKALSDLIPQFFEELIPINEAIVRGEKLDEQSVHTLHLIDNLLMVYTYDVTFQYDAHGGISNKKDIEKFLQERELLAD